jgi:hypothetical protein
MAALVLPAIAACGPAESNSDAAATPSPTKSAPATRPAAIKGACTFLPAAEVIEVLGAAEGTTLKATEMPPQQGTGGPRYSCAYGQGNRQALVLGVAQQTGSAATGVGAAVEESGAVAAPLNGLGESAATYTVGGFRYVVAAVGHEQGHRLVFLGAPQIVPQDKLTELAARLTQRI